MIVSPFWYLGLPCLLLLMVVVAHVCYRAGYDHGWSDAKNNTPRTADNFDVYTKGYDEGYDAAWRSAENYYTKT